MASAPLPLAWLTTITHWGALAASVTLTFAVAGLIVLVPWDDLPSGARAAPVAVYCVAVACARHAEAQVASGLVLLLLLPVLFQALYSRRRDLCVAVAMTTATIVVPRLVFGAPAYPPSDWGVAFLWLVVAAITGLVTNDAVERLRATEATMSRITTVAHGLTTSGDNREAICRATLEVAAADLTYLFEPAGDRLVSTAAAGMVLRSLEIPTTGEASLTVATYHAGSPQFVADLDTSTSSPRLLEATRAASGLYQPVLRGPEVVGVLFVGWQRRHGKLPPQVASSMRLLASEAAMAMERADQMSAAERLARLDPLTGLPNRRWWDEEAARAVSVRQRRPGPLTVALIDVDRFKEYNDAHGHHRGDQLLKELAAAWRDAARSSDLVARWGGEEFAVLLPGCDGPQALEMLERLLQATPDDVTCSAGATEVGSPDNLDDAVQRADAALYRAKNAGRDRVVLAGAESPAVL